MAVKFDPEAIETRTIHGLIDFVGKDILEIGCGDGRLTWRFAKDIASVLAIDPEADQIAKAIARTPDELAPIITFQVADITTLDLPADAYDVAVFTWSI